MEKQDPNVSEQELARKIVFLHDQGLGFRRVAKQLTSQGCKVNKDICNRLYNKYKADACADTLNSKDLQRLKLIEARQRQHLEEGKEKEQIRRKLAVLYVEQRTLTFEQRKTLFADQDKLLRFAERVVSPLNPMLWDEFCQFCEERGYNLANAVAIALGNQQDYEAQPPVDSDAKKRLDLYLQEGIKRCLTDWRKDEQEECEKSKEKEEKPLSRVDEEESSQHSKPEIEEWVDEEGYYNILFHQTVDDNNECP